jgi:tRNA U34 5-methylaminomethyl-2-thiouridine-forming methyltransferase MnmC
VSVQIITTDDGSHSLFNSELNETYHSVHGAIQESKHVFIKCGLDYIIEQQEHKEIHLLEVGFGTGLNALLTLQRSLSTNTEIYYTTLEAYPLDEAVWSKLNYGDALSMANYYRDLHNAKWEEWISITNNFHVLKLKAHLEIIDLTRSNYDLIYFDAFAPSKHPELWEVAILEKIAIAFKKPGTFVTYCAKGQLKRDLTNLNFVVQTLPGPPGKKEMIRALMV